MRLLATAVVLLSLAGCTSRSPDAESPGTEGGRCRPDHTCDPGLVCLSGRCVRLPDLGPSHADGTGTPWLDGGASDGELDAAFLPDGNLDLTLLLDGELDVAPLPDGEPDAAPLLDGMLDAGADSGAADASMPDGASVDATGSCTLGFADCDGDPMNGAEAWLCGSGKHCGQCYKSCDGGACNDGICGVAPTVVASGIGFAGGLAQDLSHIYVSSMSQIYRVPKAGGAPLPLAASSFASQFARLDIDGSYVYTVILGQPLPPVPGPPPPLPPHELVRIPLVGGALGKIADVYPSAGVAFQSHGASIYLSTDGSSGLLEIEKATGSQKVYSQIGEGSWVIDASGLYFIQWSGTSACKIMRLAPGSTTPTAIGADSSHSSTGLVVDATHVYWISTDERILRLPKAGGSVQTLCTKQKPASSKALAVDATHVYYLKSNATFSNSWVMKVPIQGGAPTTIAADQGSARALVVDATHVYWTTTGKVMRSGK